MRAPRAHNSVAFCAIAMRALCVAIAALLVMCFQVAPISAAYAASSKAADEKAATSKSTSSKSGSTDSKNNGDSADTKPDDSSKDSSSSTKDSKSLSTPDKKNTKESGKKSGDEAKEKRASAESLYAQANAAKASLEAAEAKFNEASAQLDAANAELDAAKSEYEERISEISRLQEDLSEYVVDMYKQGGTTPYLNVMLGATSYQEFLTSWNMATTVGNYGQDIVAEKKRIRDDMESKLATCEQKVKDAEKQKALADSNRKQINATRLAFLLQAAELDLEVAKLGSKGDAVDKAKTEVEKTQAEFDKALKEGLAGASLLSGTGYFTHPCPDSTVSSGFGYRSFDKAVHKGIDFAAPEGTPYYAADSGTVTAATNGGGDNGGAGNWIVINHGNGVVTKYMHSLVTFVSPGDHVDRGQNIGLVGTTGQSTGPHLHFQVEVAGVAVNPVSYL